MHNIRRILQFSPLKFCIGIVAGLLVTYIGLIATVVSYAASTVEFSQSVKNDEAKVATLENRYLNEVARITATNYSVLGYAEPVISTFVQTRGATALR